MNTNIKNQKRSFNHEYFYSRRFFMFLPPKIVQKGFLVCYLCLCCLIFQTDANDIVTKSSTSVLLDGVNFREYSLKYSNDLPTVFSRPLLYYIDTSESVSEQNLTRTPLISLIADLSSETGEPLFLRLTGGSSPNREHGTYGNLKINIPRIDAQVSGLYRHLGMYADAIEQFCANYENSRGYSLPYKDMGHYGVAEYITGQIKLKVHGVVSKTVFNQYGEWVTIPGLYNPLYKSGNALAQNLTIPLMNSRIFISGMIDQRTIYTDHVSSLKKIYYNVNPHYKGVFFGTDTFVAGAKLSNEKIKGNHVGFQYKHIVEKYNVSVSAGIWGAGKPDANVAVSVPFFDNSDASVMYSHVYIPEERPVTQITPGEIVTTHIKPFNYNEVRLSTNFRNCLNTPLTLELWSDYKSSYQTYFVNVTDSVLFTEFGDSDEMLFFSGGSLKLAVAFKSVNLKIWGSGNLIFRGVPFEYVPYECGVGFTHYFRGSTTIQTDFNITMRGPVHWSAHYPGKDSTRTSSRILFCDLGFKIPFISPIFSSHISPELSIKAGPVCLYPSRRPQYHPFGSTLGPLISAAFIGNIY